MCFPEQEGRLRMGAIPVLRGAAPYQTTPGLLGRCPLSVQPSMVVWPTRTTVSDSL